MRGSLRVLALSAIAGMVIVSAVPAQAEPASVSAATAPPTVTIPITMGKAPLSDGANGLVRIRLGSGKPFLVMLDTGSVGLRVFPGGWSGDVSGGFATAPFSIGGVKTTENIKFQVAPTTSKYISAWRLQGVFGILGVGVGRSPLTNPLALLPRQLGQRWSIHFVRTPASDPQRQGALVLGATIPGNAQATFPLTSQGAADNGVRYWADHKAQACWTIGRTANTCVDTWFDSGFHLTRVKGSAFADVPTTSRSGVVRTGTPVTMSAPGAAFSVWSFRAGQTLSRNVIEIFSNKGRSSINTGNVPYFDYTVTYDVNRGFISLSNGKQASS